MFVKVNHKMWINMDLVSKIVDDATTDRVTICFMGGNAQVGADWLTLDGQERDAFLCWLEDRSAHTDSAPKYRRD